MKILERNEKLREKSRRYTYKITHISVENCPRGIKLDIKEMLRHSSLFGVVLTKSFLVGVSCRNLYFFLFIYM